METVLVVFQSSLIHTVQYSEHVHQMSLPSKPPARPHFTSDFMNDREKRARQTSQWHAVDKRAALGELAVTHTPSQFQGMRFSYPCSPAPPPNHSAVPPNRRDPPSRHRGFVEPQRAGPPQVSLVEPLVVGSPPVVLVESRVGPSSPPPSAPVEQRSMGSHSPPPVVPVQPPNEQTHLDSLRRLDCVVRVDLTRINGSLVALNGIPCVNTHLLRQMVAGHGP